MTPIKRKILYIFRGTLLRIRITWGSGNMLTLSTGYNIDKTDNKGKVKWDGARCKINTTHGKEKTPANVINRYLDAVEEKIEQVFYLFEKEDRTPTKDELKNAIRIGDDYKVASFFELYDQFLSEGLHTSFWSNGTYRKLKSRKNLLLSFDENITLEAFTTDKLKEFVEFQTRNCISKESGKDTYVNSTILKNINLLKWFLRWADNKGYKVNPAYKTFKPSVKVPEKKVIFLTWDELMKVYNHDFSSNPSLACVRDCFCFCCFTSLRYSDLANLKKSDIGENDIRITKVKTNETLTIDLIKYSKAILEKYADNDSEMALPVISNQKMNDYLKIIGRICNIDSEVKITTIVGSKRVDKVYKKWELLTTHCGRRTFICYALSMGVPPNVVMKWTGHSDYNAMKPYIAIADKARKSSMSVFDINEPITN